jgi:predicted glycosyltransferase
MKRNNKKLVWIDIDNSPHVLFFHPIIEQLRKRNVNVFITARDYAQVFDLLNLFGIEYKKVGRHYGKNILLKSLGTLLRVLQLIVVVFRKKPCLTISHGSRSQMIAGNILGIKVAVAIDYEYGKGIPLFRPDLLLVPELFPEELTRSIKNVFRYKGIKEDVYVPYFKPDPSIREKLGIKNSKIVITIRPPATLAHYHTLQGDKLFKELLKLLKDSEKTYIIITPRTKDQEAEIRSQWKEEFRTGKFYIPAKVMNGLDIIWNSDLVVSGGGTMIREAAALNVPAYSTFGGQVGAVDNYLESIGRLIILRDETDIKNKIKLEKRILSLNKSNEGSDLLNEITNKIISFLN